MWREPEAVIHRQSFPRTFLWEFRMVHLHSSRQDVLEVHHVRACIWTTATRESITSPCKHPVCVAHAVRSHRRRTCFIKRSIHRLADTDLIRQWERTWTPNSRYTRVTRKGSMIRSLALGNAWRREIKARPSRVKNRLKPTAAWADWTRVMS